MGTINTGCSESWDQMGGRATRGVRRALVERDITRSRFCKDLIPDTYRDPPVRA